MTTVAELRMKALRFEEKQDWPAARDAWNATLDALKSMQGGLVQAMHHEFSARARSADVLSDEPMGNVQPTHIVEGLVKDDGKSLTERDPGAVSHLDAGPTQGDTGAR